MYIQVAKYKYLEALSSYRTVNFQKHLHGSSFLHFSYAQAHHHMHTLHYKHQVIHHSPFHW